MIHFCESACVGLIPSPRAMRKKRALNSVHTMDKLHDTERAMHEHYDDEELKSATMMTTTPPMIGPPPQTAAVPLDTSAWTAHSADADRIEKMQKHIKEALLAAEMSDLAEPVVAVLAAARWNRDLFDDPNKKQDLVAALKDPFNNYAMYEGVITVDQATHLARAAITITSALMTPAPNTRTLCGGWVLGASSA
jgi:hypothetical protein